MIWTIIAAILVLIKLVVMSKYFEVEEDDDPVWQTVVGVDRLCDVFACWETNLWSLWAMAVVENLLMRLDGSDKILYLNKLENQIIELQQEWYKQQPMSENGPLFPYFEQEALICKYTLGTGEPMSSNMV